MIGDHGLHEPNKSITHLPRRLKYTMQTFTVIGRVTLVQVGIMTTSVLLPGTSLTSAVDGAPKLQHGSHSSASLMTVRQWLCCQDVRAREYALPPLLARGCLGIATHRA